MDGVLAGLRPFRESDIDILAHLLGTAGGWATHTTPTREELHARWHRRGVDPEGSISVLPGADGRLLAYLQTPMWTDGTQRMAMEIGVHPRWRRRGIGSALYTLGMERAYRSGATHVSSPVYVLRGDRNREGAEFLQRRGFKCKSAYWQMRVADLGSQQAPSWPAGIEARPFASVQDAPQRWAELVIACFDEPATASMISRQITEPGSEPEGYFFAVDARAGKLVGTSRARLDPAPEGGVLGYVGTVGVLPEYRRRGIAQALILRTVEYLRSRGARSAVLFVEDRNSAARSLYESMGWRTVFRTDNYWKTLSEPRNGRRGLDS
jgi:mycothiol synthase